jgi:nitroreductase
MVEDPAVKEAIAAGAMLGAGNQHRARDCSALAVFLSDLEATKRVPRILELEREHRGLRHPNYSALLPLTANFLLGEGHAATWAKQLAAAAMSGGGGGSNPSASSSPAAPTIDPILAWSYKNTSLLVQTFVLACESHGLATCAMEGLDARRLSRALRVPDRYAVPMVVAAGYEHQSDESAQRTPRLRLEEVVFRDSFGVPWRWEADGKDPVEEEEDDQGGNREASGT